MAPRDIDATPARNLLKLACEAHLGRVCTRSTQSRRPRSDTGLHFAGQEIERMLRAAELVKDTMVRVELYAFAAILGGFEDPRLPPTETYESSVDLFATQVPVERWRREFQILKWAILTGNKTRDALLPIYVQCSERVPRDPDAALAVCSGLCSDRGPRSYKRQQAVNRAFGLGRPLSGLEAELVKEFLWRIRSDVSVR
jgi:hypothetical protein